MPIGPIRLGSIEVSRLIIGGNPFSGVSHQNPETDLAMKRFFTVERIKQTLRSAEELGITAFIGRADRHITRLLSEYWSEGGSIRWIAQTCPEMVSAARSIEDGVSGGAVACYLHGGVMDNLFARGELKEIPSLIRMIRDAGLPAGIAAHNPEVIEWAEQNLDIDFYMCSYYNSAHRDQAAELRSGLAEWFNDVDRDAMVSLIRRLSKPAIHYKIFAAGRKNPKDAFEFAARRLRPGDGVCIGVYQEHRPGMVAEDVRLFEEYVRLPLENSV
jgi:hypothetical protein